MDEVLKLIVPTMEFEKQIRDFRQEFLEYGGDMDGCLSLRRMDDIPEWIKQVEDFSKEATCPKTYVPLTQFICLRESDNKIVGVIQIRHFLNEKLGKYNGHIGYSVCHSERRKGYATEMLNRALKVCTDLGIENVLITCLEENEGSRRVIKNNGGVYESTVFEPDAKVYLERYWIRLSNPDKKFQ